MNVRTLKAPAALHSKGGSLPGNPKIWIGASILAALALAAAFPGLFGAGNPYALSVSERLAPPSAGNPFGTDSLGRDVYTLLIYGARISLVVGFASAVLASIAGAAIGLISASARWLDAIIMRILDGFMAIPGILFAILLVSVSGGSLRNIVVAITLIEIPSIARLVRGVALSLREQPFVEGAVAAGSTLPRILVFYFVPGILAPVLVQATFIWATAMLIEASLSFIGAGAPPSTPSWGNIMAASRSLWQVKPLLIFAPAVMLFITVMAVNLLGDGLRQWLDPRRKKPLP